MTTPNTPQKHIRRARAEDVRAIVDIKADFGPGVQESRPFYEERIPQTVIVESGGLAVAYAIWHDEVFTDTSAAPKRNRTLTEVHVHREHRRRGFGRAAVDGVGWILLDDAQAGRHPDRVLMTSTPTHNLNGQEFLDAIDFVHGGSVEYPGVGMGRMERYYSFRELDQYPPSPDNLPDGMTVPPTDAPSTVPPPASQGMGRAWV
jgi:ribosomal protein S18 acetylase RimI-like enzyme